ncbi:hypothetical protein GHNINEIG_00849 [Hydrogenovibrio crunogenus]|uniref:Uncharacterized protein n=1 Tax=Hydrogenovibrio crunogenus TaxID=39765 RepID=A0A4P7P0P6_9GAMM|nr:hypothetical protein [Hydrogenovibrio crunogenus]QBZ82812.1 hypothetical protein GHNINEIG_00849 [Hydrogenovibrio crunogenus]RUM90301.1 MAG: hypothetical protein DSZ27_08620 [Thiomicrospira sp.]
MSVTHLNYSQKKLSKTPHHIFNLNMILVHLFAVVFLFEFHLYYWFWIIPIVSIMIMLSQYAFFRSLLSREEIEHKATNQYVLANWRLVNRHNRIILMGYAIGGSLLSIGYFLSNNMTPDPNMGQIVMTIFLYLSGNLMLLILLVTFVLSSGAVWHASKGEMTRALEKQIQLLPAGNGRLSK